MERIHTNFPQGNVPQKLLIPRDPPNFIKKPRDFVNTSKGTYFNSLQHPGICSIIEKKTFISPTPEMHSRKALYDV
jgi:hypothetical protein